ncbi:hypothetical protein I4U23_021440 [Adineta vaga]|nr:hypothetical protein I4U23_021440 [Adineta vaga]
MRDRQSSSNIDLFISSTEMASTTSTNNVNELLPGLETFLRSMLSSTNLDHDHRQIAAMYADRLDELSRPATSQPTPIPDDQSLFRSNNVTDDDSDDFTDEEEEERKKQFEEEQQRLQQQQSTPLVIRRSSNNDNHINCTNKHKPTDAQSQWYIDVPKNTYLEPLSPQTPNGDHDNLPSKPASRLSMSTPTSTIIANGPLLTYDENHNWIWRYYVLDDYDLICFAADKTSLSTNQIQSDNDSSPLWVSDMTNAKVHITVVDNFECLCLQMGLSEAIYVRPLEPNQLNSWLKSFQDATSSSQKSKDNLKGRSNVKTLSRNARRIFAQFNRKKGQIVSHLLDQMANVTGVDEKTRKHCELRGFLVVSMDNNTFVTKYCTIVDGIFRIHKSRLSEQTDHELCLKRCKLSFPEEKTRDIQFALIDEQSETIFIRGNNIYSMGRLLNTLAKYVEIKGSSQYIFTASGSATSTPLSKHRQLSMSSSQPHIYSDVDSSSATINLGQSNEIYSSSSAKSIPTPQPSTPIIKATIYHNASKLHNNDGHDGTLIVPVRRMTNGSIVTSTNETYDQPKSYDNVVVMSTPVDRNNNHVVVPPQRRDKIKNHDEQHRSESHSSRHNGHKSHRVKSKSSRSNGDPSSSPENTVFCIRASDNSSTQHRHSRRRQNPLPRPSPIHNTPTEYVNKLANLFVKPFSSSSISIPQTPNPNERSSCPQTYDTLPSSPLPLPRFTTTHVSPSNTTDDQRIQFREQSMPKRVYDIPITIERSTKCVVTPLEQYQRPSIRSARSVEPLLSSTITNQNDDDEETPYSQGYDNLTKNEGIGKFRFVIPFNHSPSSAFISSRPTIKSTSSSFTTIRPTSSNINANLNNNNSNIRSTLMTAV